MEARGVEHVLVRGANRVGTAVGWLTRWPVTQEAIVVVTPGRPDTLLVGFYNHAAFDAIVARLRPGATAADLADAGRVIAAAGFAIRDDLVHGFVGGCLPPVIGARTPVPDFTFEAGITVVVQPNVVTPDERAGVQTGELLVVGANGAERLRAFSRGLLATPARA
jgi:hypothetical protein